jgi:uncharacterized repeat protein (TIGR03803 family)
MRTSRSRFLLCATALFAVISFVPGAAAQSIKPLARFEGQNGAEPPFGSMIQATDGNYYGAASSGGENGWGAIFRVTSTGRLDAIYSFCGFCAEGSSPYAAPILGDDGNLYGTTQGGGNSSNAGTIFRLATSGQLTTLYSFCPGETCSDGEFPVGLIQASDGNFYGTTSDGGVFGGTLFELTSSGQFKLLYSFCAQRNCTDGAHPFSAPMQASNSNLYGTTYDGGSEGRGVVYELTRAGKYSVVYNFCSQTNCTDGWGSWATLVEDAKGNLYGTAGSGGAYGRGAVFRISPSDEYKVLHSFDGTEGAGPQSALTLANDGNLYGTTIAGDSFNSGNIYEITPSGEYKSLSDFCNVTTCVGDDVEATLLQATNGVFYGSAYEGPDDDGTVFTFDDSLIPLVKTVPTAGEVGRRVIILGNGLTGSSSVTFNGVAAAFTVESDTYISATVPVGAATGVVSVVTPAGTLNSNPQFVVVK